jgi:hypothetical protein
VEGSNAIGNLQRLELLRLFVRKEIVDRITKTDAGATSEGEKLLPGAESSSGLGGNNKDANTSFP